MKMIQSKQIEGALHGEGKVPLTLTLSLGEVEQPSDVLRFFSAHPANPVARFFVRLNSILPLPAGEGRDEGEMAKHISRRFNL